MIEGLKPYPEYKESGLPWLGRCPKNWSIRRTKILFHERAHKGFPNEPLLAATQTKGVVKKEDYETRTVTAQKDLHLLKLVEVGDYVISLRSFQGGIEVAHCRGIISPAYTVLKPRKQATSGYYSHFFKAKPFIDSLSLFVTGIREGQNIDYERLSRAELPMPSEEEQAAIVRFLDHANRKIDGFIRAKRKLIGLLNEQKQAIIHRAVTRGLHPDVPLKPSGIPWLGDIPKHWEALALKRWVVTRITDGPHETPVLLESGISFMSAESMVNGKLDFNRRRGFISKEVHETFCRKCRPQRDDIFMCKSGATTGKVAIVETDEPFSVWSPLALIRVDRRRVLPRLLFFVLQSGYIRRQVQDLSSYGTQPNLAMGAMARIVVAMPPIAEQPQLLRDVEADLVPIDTAIARTEREIALMQEYRTRLTADLVTGKLDVREAAAHLPDLSADAAPDPAPEETEV